MEPDSEAVADATKRALAAGLAGDRPGQADAVADLAAMGPAAVHVALYAWAAITFTLTVGVPGALPEDVFAAPFAVNARTGRPASLDQIPRAAADAMRLVACAANDDQDMIEAILKATWDDLDTLVALIMETLNLAVTAAAASTGDRHAR